MKQTRIISTILLILAAHIVTVAQKAGFQLKPASFPMLPEKPQTVIGPRLPRWTPDELPFFCKIEHNWGKKTPVPFKFRLGSVDYVDWLEGHLPRNTTLQH